MVINSILIFAYLVCTGLAFRLPGASRRLAIFGLLLLVLARCLYLIMGNFVVVEVRMPPDPMRNHLLDIASAVGYGVTLLGFILLGTAIWQLTRQSNLTSAPSTQREEL